MGDQQGVAPTSRLSRLLGYLEVDPQNRSLLSDAAECALAENEPAIARDLLDRCAGLSALAPREVNLAGLAALSLQDFSKAAAMFERAMEGAPGDASLRFNLAWSRAQLKQFDAASALLDEATVNELPQAAMLQIQIWHQQGQFAEAFERVKVHLGRHPDHPGLLAAASVLALDVEDPAFAAACAHRAGDQPDAMTTLGALALSQDRNVEALDLFGRALEANAHIPRAWVGRGLTRLLIGEHQQAVADIRHGAEMFGDHSGSWIAAGWASVIAGDVESARECFEKALAIDHNFSEPHGSLAVVALLTGDHATARQMTRTALRLDPHSFSGALAQALLLSGEGKPDAARKLIDRALNTPIDSNGRTIAQSLVRYGLSA